MLALHLLAYEQSLWSAGVQCIAGIDEAGRGALAGPVVAAVVCCDDHTWVARLAQKETAALIRDSKTLSRRQRSIARELVRGTFASSAVGVVTSWEIDQFGIAAGNRMAMERALLQIDRTPDFLLLDACTIDSSIPQWGIIDGDAQSILIAAASILAKTARDEIMDAMGVLYPGFAFDQHRGYCTEGHLEELKANGPCEIHRQSFEPVRISLGEIA